MPGEGPFLWLSSAAPPAGFSQLPKGGMCLSVFLFVADRGRLLLGKYKDDPKWEELAGLDPDRRRMHGRGWTIPASQLKYGEDPRTAAHRIAEEMLEISGSAYSEPRVEVDYYEPKRFPGALHYDVWFFVDAMPPARYRLKVPSWFSQLEWHDPRELPASAYARSHDDVVARWLGARREST